MGMTNQQIQERKRELWHQYLLLKKIEEADTSTIVIVVPLAIYVEEKDE